MVATTREFNGPYRGEHLRHVAFPMGGMGAGMICLEGSGALSHVSLRHRPQVFHEPLMFTALCVRGRANVARVLEGPVPDRKVFWRAGGGNGLGDTALGLPRFAGAAFTARFPFGQVRLRDRRMPVDVQITGWSPFIPGDADSASLPVAALEYHLTSRQPRPLEAVFSFHAANFMAVKGKPDPAQEQPAVRAVRRGFVLWQPPRSDIPAQQGAFCAVLDHAGTRADAAWFRGGWFDSKTMLWDAISGGRVLKQAAPSHGEPSPGGSLYLPLTLRPGAPVVLRLLLCWHVPESDVRSGPPESGHYRPWYAQRFAGIDDVAAYWRKNYTTLRRKSQLFSDCFHDTNLPPEVVEAVAANLTILKSPTVLRQADGRPWGWEGCRDEAGCCAGSCTHVWNYAQALPHLFPDLERSLRETEFGECQDAQGHQTFRAALPIRPAAHDFHAAADGQLGGILKLYRDWRISGDSTWMRRLWPAARQGLHYCIQQWDPDHLGVLVEPHHNTYDIEFWGPEGMCGSFYLAALAAAVRLGQACGEDVSLFARLLRRGQAYVREKLFNGAYFQQQVRWKDLRAGDPVALSNKSIRGNYSPEALAILQREGPKYQYGSGCLSDGVIGAWMALVCGMDQDILDPRKVRAHLRSVHRHNLKRDLSAHANPQRPGYALGREGGLLTCSWPRGGKPSLPFPYSEEVFTGIEYQVASHLMFIGEVRRGLEIVRHVRRRYDGTVRNPFNEYECGHWYARALSSYAMLQALSGVRYDAVEQALYLRPGKRGNVRCFLATATGFGTVRVRGARAKLEVKSGWIPVKHLRLLPP